MKQSGSGSNQDCPTNSTATKRTVLSPTDLSFVGFFDPILFHPEILDNPPQEHSRKFSSTLFDDQNIRRINFTEHYLNIFLKTKEERLCQKQLSSIQKWSFQNQELVNTIQKVHEKLTSELPKFIQIVEEKKMEFSSFSFPEWLKKVESKNFIALHLPITQSGPRLRSMVMSKKALSILDYELEESVLELSKYRSLCFDILDNKCYCQLFSLYTRTFENFLTCEKNIITWKKIEEESVKVVTNNFIGRNNRSVKAQIRFSMPSPFIICIQIVKLIKRAPFEEDYINYQKISINEEIEQMAIKSLVNVARIKNIPSKDQSRRISSYRKIEEQDFFYEMRE